MDSTIGTAVAEDAEDFKGLDIKEILALLFEQNRDLSRRLGRNEQVLQNFHKLSRRAMRETITSVMQEVSQKAVYQDKKFNRMESRIDDLLEQIEIDQETRSEELEYLYERFVEDTHNQIDDYMVKIEQTRLDQTGVGLQSFSDNLHKKFETESSIIQHKLRNDIRRVHDMLKSPCWCFPQFLRLPHELRAMVWHFAIPTRLFHCDQPRRELDEDYRLTVPAIAHVCRESRQVALRLGRLFPLHLEDNRSAWSFYSFYTPDRDIVLLRKVPISVKALPPGIEEVALEPEHDWCQAGVSASSERIVSWLSDVNFGDPRAFPRLRTISVLVKKPTIVDRIWHPSVVARLFQGNSVVITKVEASRLDLLQKQPNPERLREVFGPDHVINRLGDDRMPGVGETIDLVQRDLFSSLVHGASDGARGNWPGVKKRLWKRFLEQRYCWSPLTVGLDDLTNPDMSPNLEIPWVMAHFSALKIRPVHIFALLDGQVNFRQARRSDSHRLGLLPSY